MSYRHAIRVRFGEVDHQGVVFNAHYLAYIDDTLENWVAEDGDLRAEHSWDMMLKKVELVWSGSVGNGDILLIDAAVERFHDFGATRFENVNVERFCGKGMPGEAGEQDDPGGCIYFHRASLAAGPGKAMFDV